MTFQSEREAAQRALEDGPDVTPYPPAAARIRAARETAGLSWDEAAAGLGIGDMAYYDVEHYDDEVFTVLDLGQIRPLAAMIGLTVSAMLFGEDPPAPLRTITPLDVVAALSTRLQAEDSSIEHLSDAIGWDIGPLLQAPDRLWSDFPIDGANAVCSAVGLDWFGLLV